MHRIILFLKFLLKCAAKLEVFLEICNIFAKKMQEINNFLGIGNAIVDISVQLGCMGVQSGQGLSAYGIERMNLNEILGR